MLMQRSITLSYYDNLTWIKLLLLAAAPDGEGFRHVGSFCHAALLGFRLRRSGLARCVL